MYESALARSAEAPRRAAPARPAAAAAAPEPSGLVAPGLLAPGEVPAILWGSRLGLASGALAGALAGLAFLLAAQPSYVATTQAIVDPQDLHVVDNGLRPAQAPGDGQIAEVENDVRLMTSVAVLSRVVEAQNLASDPDFTGARPSGLAGLLGEALGRTPAAPADPAKAALRTLAASVSAKREERTYVVDVTAKARDPVRAAQLADAVVAAFQQVGAEQREASARRIAGALDGRLDGMRRALEAAEKRVVDYRAGHGLVAAVGSDVAEQQLVGATGRLGELKAQLADADSRYAQARAAEASGDPGAVPEALGSSTIGGLRAQFTEAKRREQDLAATLGPRHPSLNEARAQERAVKGQIAAELARIAATLRTNRDRIKADLAAAQGNYRTLSAGVTANGEASVSLAELQRAAQADRAVYESTLARSRQVAEQERIDAADVSVISPAQVPDAKSWPPRPAAVLGGAALLGLCVAAALALGLEWMRRRREAAI